MNEPLLLREPAGLRALELPCWIVGHRQDVPQDLQGEVLDRFVLVPGLPQGARLCLTRSEQGLHVAAEGAARAARNGIDMLAGDPCRLQLGDVLTFGEAQIRLESITPPTLEIVHLEGNQTIAPPGALRDKRPLADEWINAEDGIADSAQLPAATPPPRRLPRAFNWGVISLLVLLVLSLAVFARLERVELRLYPQEARVSVEGLGWRAGDVLLVWPGTRRVTATLEGHQTLQRDIVVRKEEPLSLTLRLEELPGLLDIDTGGVKAIAYIDGAEVGEVPGELSVAAGKKTLTLRAERYLDEVLAIEVAGRGARQPLTVALRPSWGRLEVSADRAAVLTVEGPTGDGIPSSWQLPANIEVPAGLHRLTVSAPNTRAWQSAVVVEAGKTKSIGPLQLGAADGQLRVSSRPAGAAIMVNGVFAGRTPATLDLAPGIEHPISLTLEGYRGVDRRVSVEPARRADLAVTLQMIGVSLQVRGEPEAAEIWLGNRRLGTAPLTVELPAARHSLEVRKAGLRSQRLEVDLASAVSRQIDYRLVPEGKPADWSAPAAQWRGQSGTQMRLFEGGSFLMGSDRREQGRRANEFQRRVSLTRPFYMALREVTNAEYRQFKAGHSSGFLGKRTLDLDSAAVSGVSWQDAVQYCNWLSARDGLPLAYEQQNGQWVLRQPVGTGYRLPTEAEWEFVARQVGAGGATRRYEWGNALPPPRNFANLAGIEVGEALPKTLPDWQDDHPVVAPPGRYPANGFGIFDLGGNVSEWVHDRYASAAPEGASSDPLGPDSGARHVIKGASWRTSVYTDLRIAWREGAEAPAQDVGFRVARYAE